MLSSTAATNFSKYVVLNLVVFLFFLMIESTMNFKYLIALKILQSATHTF